MDFNHRPLCDDDAAAPETATAAHAPVEAPKVEQKIATTGIANAVPRLCSCGRVCHCDRVLRGDFAGWH
jgi:hypothetical protein